MTLEEQLAEQAKRGLLGLGLEQETAEEYAPWASLLAQFLPGVGEGVGIDNTVDAIQDERYGDAAIEGGLTLLGAVPVIGDVAAAAIKGIRKAPVKAFDEAAWLKDNPRPHPDVKTREMSPEQTRDYSNWRQRKYAEKNRQKLREKNSRWRHENPEKQSQAGKNWRENNKERVRENNRAYYESNKEQGKERARKWVEDNPDRKLANNASRRAARLERMPAWADPDRIDEIYRTASDISAETGIPHHVDHVMPMQGRNISGLHHQDNLLIVPSAENLSKSNKFEPGDLPPRAGVRKSRAYLKKIREAKEKAKR